MACLNPVHKPGTARYYPCQRCTACREKIREQFANRLFLESRVSKSSFFCTFTYSEENLPWAGDKPCFDKPLCSKFLRRLRDFLSYTYGSSLRYFFTCEYGDLTERIHYHAICYLSVPMSLDEFQSVLNHTWKEGFSYAGTVTTESCMYVSKYCLKDDETDNYPPSSPFKPFRFFSRNPGIGCTDECLKHYGAKLRLSFKQSDGPGIPWIPRPARAKLNQDLQDKLTVVGMTRFEDMQGRLAQIWDCNSQCPEMVERVVYSRTGDVKYIKVPFKELQILQERKKRRILRKTNNPI